MLIYRFAICCLYIYTRRIFRASMCRYPNFRCLPACIYYYIRCRHCRIEIKFLRTLRIAVPAVKRIICIYRSRSGRRCKLCIISVQGCGVFYRFMMLNFSSVWVIQPEWLQFTCNMNSLPICRISILAWFLIFPEFCSCRLPTNLSSRILIQIIARILLVNCQCATAGSNCVYQFKTAVCLLVVIINRTTCFFSCSVKITGRHNAIWTNISRIICIACRLEIIGGQKNTTISSILMSVPVILGPPFSFLQICPVQTCDGPRDVPFSTPTSLFPHMIIHRTQNTIIIYIHNRAAVCRNRNALAVHGILRKSVVAFRDRRCVHRRSRLACFGFCCYICVGLLCIRRVLIIGHLLLPVDHAIICSWIFFPFCFYGNAHGRIGDSGITVIPALKAIAVFRRLCWQFCGLSCRIKFRCNIASAIWIIGHPEAISYLCI